ncbi:MAG: hypothetical protein ABJC33_03935 [Betaproteobacteria bacterium]
MLLEEGALVKSFADFDFESFEGTALTGLWALRATTFSVLVGFSLAGAFDLTALPFATILRVADLASLLGSFLATTGFAFGAGCFAFGAGRFAAGLAAGLPCFLAAGFFALGFFAVGFLATGRDAVRPRAGDAGFLPARAWDAAGDLRSGFASFLAMAVLAVRGSWCTHGGDRENFKV